MFVPHLEEHQTYVEPLTNQASSEHVQDQRATAAGSGERLFCFVLHRLLRATGHVSWVPAHYSVVGKDQNSRDFNARNVALSWLKFSGILLICLT